MNWHLAVEKNHEALRRILATLVALVGMTDGASVNPGVARKNTLPRHLHRYVLRLLRPAEAATRRLIIVAARGLVVKLPPFRPRKPSPKKPPLNRKNGYGTGMVIRPGPLPEWAKSADAEALAQPVAAAARSAQAVRRPPAVREAKRDAADQGVGRRSRSSRCSAGRSRCPARRLPQTIRSMRRSIHRRLDAIGRALDDLPGRRSAWRAGRRGGMRDGRGREVMRSRGQSSWKTPPHRLALRARHLSPISWGRGNSKLERRHRHRDSSPPRSGGEVASPKGETERG